MESFLMVLDFHFSEQHPGKNNNNSSLLSRVFPDHKSADFEAGAILLY